VGYGKDNGSDGVDNDEINIWIEKRIKLKKKIRIINRVSIDEGNGMNKNVMNKKDESEE
jgi:hypothetical protein